MTTSVPNLWEGKITRNVLTPVAILRTQAGNFDAETQGALRAEVHTKSEVREGESLIVHTFEIIAPGLSGYRRGVLTAEHPDPGAYPVVVKSFSLPIIHHLNAGYVEDRERTCRNQEQFLKALEDVFGSEKLTTEIESLIAQINDASDPDTDG